MIETMWEQIYNHIPAFFLMIGLIAYCAIVAGKDKKAKFVYIIIALCFLDCVCTISNLTIDVLLEDYGNALRQAIAHNGWITMEEYLTENGYRVFDVQVFRYVESSIAYAIKPTILFVFWRLIKVEKSKWYWTVIMTLPLVACIVLYATSFATQWFFWFDNVFYFYHGGAGHSFIYFVCGYYTLLVTKETYLLFKKDAKRSLLFFAILVIGYFGSSLLEGEMAGVYILDTVIMECLVFYYLFLHTHSMQEALVQKEKDLRQKEIELKVSQIKPHFIFNTLSTIIDLCPEKSDAQNALYDFSKYLRVNIDMLNDDKLMPFSEEIEYIKNYVRLEQYSYGKRLKVSYDCACTDFMLPLLSVQPLVENAVKYGFKVRRNISILIRSLEEKKCYKIIVEDNAGGFVVGTNKTKKSTGIENIRYRLKEMVNATLRYEAIENGTRAIIEIPKEKV